MNRLDSVITATHGETYFYRKIGKRALYGKMMEKIGVKDKEVIADIFSMLLL